MHYLQLLVLFISVGVVVIVIVAAAAVLVVVLLIYDMVHVVCYRYDAES